MMTRIRSIGERKLLSSVRKVAMVEWNSRQLLKIKILRRKILIAQPMAQPVICIPWSLLILFPLFRATVWTRVRWTGSTTTRRRDPPRSDRAKEQNRHRNHKRQCGSSSVMCRRRVFRTPSSLVTSLDSNCNSKRESWACWRRISGLHARNHQTSRHNLVFQPKWKRIKAISSTMRY